MRRSSLLVFGGVATFLLLAATATQGGLAMTLLLAVVIALTAVTLAAPLVILRREAWLRVLARPIGAWAIVSTIYWVVGSSLVLFTSTAIFHTHDEKMLPLAQLYFLLGAWATVIGYFLGRPLRTQTAFSSVPYARWTTLQVAAVLAGMKAVTFLLRGDAGAGDLGRVDEQVVIVAGAIVTSLSLVVLFDSAYARWCRLLALVLFGDVILRAATSGSRFAVIGLALSVMAVFVLTQSAKPRIWKLVLLGALVAAGVLLSQASRDLLDYAVYRERGASAGDALGKVLRALGDEQVRSDAVSNLARTTLSERLAPVDTLAWAIETMEGPRGAFMQGESMLSGFVRVAVPYFLFPEKPGWTPAEGWLSELAGYSGDTHSNATQEFYVNFGLLGILAGLFLVGMIWALLERWLLSPRSRTTGRLAAYVILYGSILTAEREMADYLFATLRLILLVVAIDVALTSYNRRTRGVRVASPVRDRAGAGLPR